MVIKLEKNEDRDQQIWHLFRGSSASVFISKKENVKGVGGKVERKKPRSVVRTKQKNRK